MYNKEIKDEYFDWLCELVCKNRYDRDMTYYKLLEHLHETRFSFRLLGDSDRAHDGMALRHRFALIREELYDHEYDYIIECLYGPCSVLEMMIALAIRCEEEYMTDTKYGDRTAQWFWRMIVNLGLGSMTDNLYQSKTVEDIIDSFLNRDFEPDGRGGLFTIKNCARDLRRVDIWTSLMWYLDTMM